MNFEKKLQFYVKEHQDAPGDIILATRLLVRSARMLEMRINMALEPFAIQIHEYLAMVVIKFEEGPLRPTELSETLGISRPQITRLLDSLEKRGFIGRQHSKVDRRALLLSLTAKGKKQLDTAAPVVHAAYQECWKDCTMLTPMLEGLKELYSELREAEAHLEED